MNVETNNNEDTQPTVGEGGGSVPSGFILKLFQMVNGAPDEVISWTPAGDAFIIGSDLTRLESETLPQYFRHNRFQSLVRQVCLLNFYSFRKINRERNVWIYKHKLFHRDRPEDLHQVRRRTCPGVDGRKQRFSRFSAQKLSKYDDDKANASSDESSSEDASGDESAMFAAAANKKRRAALPLNSSNKRARSPWEPELAESPVKADITILPEPVASPSSVVEPPKTLIKEPDAEENSVVSKRAERLEMIERSSIVSEVAMKLEEYVKKAMKGRGSGRSRRTGVVTPPYGSSTSNISFRGLITYDDEYEVEDCSGVITDGDDSLQSSVPDCSVISNAPNMFAVPVSSEDLVKKIVTEIKQRAESSSGDSEVIHACAMVAELLMSNAPGEDIDSSSTKIAALLASSNVLAMDFRLYRSALRPENAEEPRDDAMEHDHVSIVQQTLGSGSGRAETLRQFKIFAANLLYKLLGKNGGLGIQKPLSLADSATLLRAADAWSKSVVQVV
eukprot:Nitzschia sp. Nitz4//scaffold20_size174350//32995//35424//NITZ4_002086-RA/size174350-augustus-gene-0.46-mRNA-1//-1//CDS//3329541761//140//frame0